MKKSKVLASFLAVLMLMMSLTTMVSAANVDNDTATVTIQNNSSTTGVSISGVAFNLYRVFDLVIVDANPDEEISESITYSVADEFTDFFDGVLDKTLAEYTVDIGTGKTYENEDDAILAYNNAALEYVNDCKTYGDDGSVETNTMAELVADLRSYILDEDNSGTSPIEPTSTTGKTASNTNGVETITSAEVAYGYYLILDADGTTENGGVVPTGSLVTVPGLATDGTRSADVTVVMKGSIPEMNKEVWHNDIDNTDGDKSPLYDTAGSWDTVSDYQINDTIEYRITATIPSDLRGYTSKESYTYTITDTLSAGLEIDEGSVKIYTSPTLSESSLVAGGYHVVTYGQDVDNFTFTIDFDMYGIVNDTSLDGIEEFYIYYTATVSDEAVIDKNYESNTATLTYSNNPYDETSFGEIESTVYTYTFDVDILKTSGDGVTALEGAVFALYEVSGEGVSQQLTQIYLELDTTTETDAAQVYYPVSQEASSEVGVITTNESGEFDIFGLDDATTYMLKEIKAPTGFNAVDPITFMIQASYDTTGGGVPVLTVSTTGTDFSTDGSGLYGTIINTSNQLLPSTGGIGTTIFYIAGGVIMVAAVVLLIVKRKKTTVRYK